MGAAVCRSFGCDSIKQKRAGIKLKLSQCKGGIDSKGMKVNMYKANVMINGESHKGL